MTRDEFDLIVSVEQAFRPSKEAKIFVWSDGVTVGGHEFFDHYGWDSPERMHVNEYSTYFEVMALAWRNGFLSDDAVDEWVSAPMAWEKVGHILLAAREIIGDERLWEGFEALTLAQQGRATPD